MRQGRACEFAFSKQQNSTDLHSRIQDVKKKGGIGGKKRFSMNKVFFKVKRKKKLFSYKSNFEIPLDLQMGNG